MEKGYLRLVDWLQIEVNLLTAPMFRFAYSENSSLRSAFLLTLASFLALSYIAFIFRGTARTGLFNYHVYLAEAFVNGSLALVRHPPTTHDLSIFNGRLYLYWGPMPAVVLMPVVYLFGANWPDIWISLTLAALNIGAVFLLLETTRDLHGLSRMRSILLAVTFGFGSPCLPLAIDGTVWYVGQLFATLFLTSGVTLSFRARRTSSSYVVPALLIGMACLTRASVVGAAGWLLGFIFIQARKSGRSWLKSLSALIPASTVLGSLASLILLYNYARFGSAWDNGVNYHQPSPQILADIRAHGLFSFYYLARNFFYHYIAYPFPASEDSLMGGSLFLMTPLFLGAFFANELKEHSKLIGSLWGTIFILAIPSLLICGTGWTQIGPRYTLDYAPFLLLLVALGIGRWSSNAVALLAGASIAQYFYGLAVLR